MPDTPTTDLRPQERRRQALKARQQAREAQKSDDGPGRLSRLKEAATTKLKKANAKRRTKERAAELQQARAERTDGPTVSERILGEDAAEEVAAFVDSVGPQPTEQEFEQALGVDFDGDGKTLGEEVGLGEATSQRLDDDLQALDRGGLGKASRESQLYRAGERRRDAQLEDDLRALGRAGQEARDGR